MSDVWEKMILDLNQIGEKVANKTGIYIKKAILPGNGTKNYLKKQKKIIWRFFHPPLMKKL